MEKVRGFFGQIRENRTAAKTPIRGIIEEIGGIMAEYRGINGKTRGIIRKTRGIREEVRGINLHLSMEGFLKKSNFVDFLGKSEKIEQPPKPRFAGLSKKSAGLWRNIAG
jgi:hypothetical protein